MSLKDNQFFQQPRAVWAVAFACVIAFMGIGLVDPILKPIADQLEATPSPPNWSRSATSTDTLGG